MTIGPAGALAVFEVIVYTPALVAALVVCSRHGWRRASGWFYTIFLCIVRIAGAVCQLVMSNSNPSDGLLKATIILDSIGLSPLLFATLGVISRYVDWIHFKQVFMFGVREFRLVQLCIGLGMILSIAGGSSVSSSDNGTVTISDTSKAAIALYIVAFAGTTIIGLVSAGYRSAVPGREQRSLAAVAVAWPFILIRLVYSVLAVLGHNSLFSVVGGSVIIRAFMAVVEEFIVVVVYLVLGLSLERLEPENQGQLASRQWKPRR